MVPPELSTSFGVKTVYSAPDLLPPHLATSLKDNSVFAYVYTLDPSMCAELKHTRGARVHACARVYGSGSSPDASSEVQSTREAY